MPRIGKPKSFRCLAKYAPTPIVSTLTVSSRRRKSASSAADHAARVDAAPGLQLEQVRAFLDNQHGLCFAGLGHIDARLHLAPTISRRACLRRAEPGERDERILGL